MGICSTSEAEEKKGTKSIPRLLSQFLNYFRNVLTTIWMWFFSKVHSHYPPPTSPPRRDFIMDKNQGVRVHFTYTEVSYHSTQDQQYWLWCSSIPAGHHDQRPPSIHWKITSIYQNLFYLYILLRFLCISFYFLIIIERELYFLHFLSWGDESRQAK